MGGGAEKRRVVAGGGWGAVVVEGHWRMMRDCKVSMQNKACEQNADRAHAALYIIIHILKNDFTPSSYIMPFMLQEFLCNYCLTGTS